MAEHEVWVMPEWMEKYRKHLDRIGGGNTVENLMNDHTSNQFNNVIRAGMICQMSAMTTLLYCLRADGLLVGVDPNNVVPTDSPLRIDSFDGEYAFLSNFHMCEVVYEEIPYPSAEHAFQAAKTLDIGSRHQVRKCETAGKAKRMGRKVTLRSDWEDVKFDVMDKVVTDKFMRHPQLSDKLKATGIAHLEEGNNWHDNIWGDCPCDSCKDTVGKNYLGKTLMHVREVI